MSDSDDTDILLLIPPDFFFVAPSPSPASSPSTPSSPIHFKNFNPERLSLTEELAKKSLTDLTSQLKVIDRRLSFLENQRSDSMDGDRSSNWFDLESHASGSNNFHSNDSMEKSSDWRSMNVEELIRASSRAPLLSKDPPMSQNWRPSARDYQLSPGQRARSMGPRRESALPARAVQGNEVLSSDEEMEWSRERRAASLPPTPGARNRSQQAIANTSPSTHKQPLLRENNSSRWTGINVDGRKEPLKASKGRSDATSFGGKDEGAGWLEFARNYKRQLPKEEEERISQAPGGRSEWIDQRPGGEESLKLDHQPSNAPEGAESFDLNASNLDGTLGVSAIIPSLSSLGLGTSYMLNSLDGTKETCGSGGGISDGLSLSQVEKLLDDMQKTQAEMEKSMRRGMKKLGKRGGGEGDRQRDERPLTEAVRKLEIGDGDHVRKISEMDKSPLNKSDVGVCKEGIVRNEIRRREEWLVEGKNQSTSKAPVKIFVDGTPKKEQTNQGQGDTSQASGGNFLSERGLIEGHSSRDAGSIYRSKSDESLSGGHGKQKESSGTRYFGVESSDDSLISGGPITASRMNRLGDNIGSVPDLGLGVREMFANPSRHRDAVKEPPCVKKNMTMLGCANPQSMDFNTRFPQENSMPEPKSFTEVPTQKMVFNSPLLSAGDSRTWPRSPHNKEGGGVSAVPARASLFGTGLSPQAIHPRDEVIEKREFVDSPHKNFPSPRVSQYHQENLARDARRQLRFDEAKHDENKSIVPDRTSSMPARPPVRDGGEDRTERQGNLKESGETTGAVDLKSPGLLNSMGPVMVVGGEGRRRKRRLEGGNSSFDGDGRVAHEDDKRPDGTQRRGNEMPEGGGHKGQGRRREAGHSKAWEEAREKWANHGSGHRSLDDTVGFVNHGKYKEWAFDGMGARNTYRGSHAAFEPSFLTGSDLWSHPVHSNAGATATEEILKLRRKLEEERFRREHCERVIEEVGRRALEAQERLAVSQGLSKAKDIALGKFREVWEEAVTGWKREGEARMGLEEEVDRYRERVKAEISYRDQHLKQLEGQIVELSHECSTLREELRKGQRETADITTRLSTMLEAATKELAECRKEAENAALRETRAQDFASRAEEAVKEANKKLDDETKRANSEESEKNMLKQELETMQGKLRDSTSRIVTLEGRLADAEVALDRARQNEKKAREDLALVQQEFDKERVKLKDFYQSQVEELVKSKVNEFQAQLDGVELSLRKEADAREEQARKVGEERLRLLSQKNTQEVNLLEQKHEEELALWGLRLKKAMAEVDSLRSQVSKYNSQKSQLAKGLHALMQAQLKQGLRLIASGGEGGLHEATPSPPKRTEKMSVPLETSWRDVMASLNYPENSEFVPEKDSIPKKDADKDLGYQSMIREKESIGSVNKSSGGANSDLKKYIQMLLDREPGKPVNWMEMDSDSEGDMENQRNALKQRQNQGAKEMSKTHGNMEDERENLKEREISKGSRRSRRKELEAKMPKEPSMRATWENMDFKLNEQMSGSDVFDKEEGFESGRRGRKPPWK